MVGGSPTPPPELRPPARCRCGHLPGAHMRVLPIASGGSVGGFRLDPSGPCAVCGAPRCAAFSPDGPPRVPP